VVHVRGDKVFDVPVSAWDFPEGLSERCRCEDHEFLKIWNNPEIILSGKELDQARFQLASTHPTMAYQWNLVPEFAIDGT